MDDIKLSEQERDYYHQIFEFCADEDIDSSKGPSKAVSAVKVKEIFPLSGVEGSHLKQIWSLCANK